MPHAARKFGFCDADGQVHTVERYNGNVGTNLVATGTSTYDNQVGRLTQLQYTGPNGTTVLAQYDYTYDRAGNLTGLNILGDGNSAQGYDANNQLTSASLTGETYVYDDTGNRTSANGQAVTTSADNRLTDDGTFTYTYDLSGDRWTQTRKSSAAAADYYTEYTWDHAHRLVGITVKDNGTGGTAAVSKTYSATYVYGRKRGHSTFSPPGATGGLPASANYERQGH